MSVIPYKPGNNLLCDWHVHTYHDHGEHSPDEMAASAYNAGCDSLGLVIHTPMPYHTTWASTADSYGKFKHEAFALKEKYRDRMKIFVGAEYDPDSSPLLESGELDLSGLDFVLGAAHQLTTAAGAHMPIDGLEDFESMLSVLGGEGLTAAYFDAVTDVALTPFVDIVAHFDLIGKYGEQLAAQPYYTKIALGAVREILRVRPGMIFEVNTGGMFRYGKKEPYPVGFILREIVRLGGRITLGSDAHESGALFYKFDTATEHIKMAGYR